MVVVADGVLYLCFLSHPFPLSALLYGFILSMS